MHVVIIPVAPMLYLTPHQNIVASLCKLLVVSCLFQDQQPATKETPSIFAVFRDFQALPLFIIEIRV